MRYTTAIMICLCVDMHYGSLWGYHHTLVLRTGLLPHLWTCCGYNKTVQRRSLLSTDTLSYSLQGMEGLCWLKGDRRKRKESTWVKAEGNCLKNKIQFLPKSFWEMLGKSLTLNFSPVVTNCMFCTFWCPGLWSAEVLSTYDCNEVSRKCTLKIWSTM